MDWLAVLKRITPSGNPMILKGVADAMPNVINVAKLTTQQRQAYFLGQCGEESDGFKTVTEYASGKEYEGRHDLGNTQAGDGPRYKGRGVIQLTGRSNYARYGKELGLDLVRNPPLAGAFPTAVLVAALYWEDHGLNAYADRGDIVGVTKKVNGGTNGIDMRRRYTSLAAAAISQADKLTPAKLIPPTTPVPVIVPTLPHPTQPAPAPVAVKPPGFWASLLALLFHPRSA